MDANLQEPQAEKVSNDPQLQVEKPSLQVPSQAISTIEALSKAAALLFACIYGFGFLVVSLNEADYGILQFNLLKARIFAAGALFMLLLAIPTFAIRRVLCRSLIPEASGHSWLKWSFDTDRYFNRCLVLGGASFGVMWKGNLEELAQPLSHWPAVVLALAMSLNLLMAKTFMRNYKTHPEKCTLLPLGEFVLANIVVLYVFRAWTGYATFVYWFFVVGMYSAWLDDRLRRQEAPTAVR